MRGIGACCVGVALLVSTASEAAMVLPIQGVLFISQGHGFQQVRPELGPVEANVGDSVMVSYDGSAIVTYSDGCKVNLQPGRVMTITALSPCASISSAQEPPKPPEFNLTTAAAVGGVTAAALAVGIYEATRPHPPPPPVPASP